MTKWSEPVVSDPQIALAFQKLKAILDGGISFDDNMDVSIVTYTSNGTPNTQDAVNQI